MKKLLVLGASEFQIPLLKQAREMGLYVCVLDINPNSRGVKHANDYYQCSLKDVDKAISIAKSIQPDGVTVGMCDVAVCTAAKICEELDLPGLDFQTAKRATDKFLMVSAFKEHCVPHPEYMYIQKEDIGKRQFKFPLPCISKPIDMAGSRGINKISEETELLSLLKDSSLSSDSGDIIVEEYMEGPEVSVEILVIDHTPTVLQVTDKYTSGAPHFIEIGHSQPSQLSEETIEAVSDVAKKAVNALGLYNCFAHAEIIITNRGPKMVEIGARMGGDGIQEQLLLLSRGINAPLYAINFALGIHNEQPPQMINMCSAIKFIQSRPGIVQTIDYIEKASQIDGIKQIEILCKPGDKMRSPTDNSDRMGYIISQEKTVEKALAACEEAASIIKIVVE